MSTKRKAEVAQWLLPSQIETSKASVIKGLSPPEIDRLRRVSERKFRKTLLSSELQIAIAAIAASRPLTVVQVGANDGKSGDPVFPFIQEFSSFAR